MAEIKKIVKSPVSSEIKWEEFGFQMKIIVEDPLNSQNFY